MKAKKTDTSLTLEIVANLLMTSIKEDRIEIRLNKENIYKIVSFITISSFALTAYILDPTKKLQGSYMYIIDAALLIVLWVVFVKMKIDLDIAHKCSEKKEELLRTVLDEKIFITDIFLNKTKLNDKPTINERGLYYIVIFATITILLKNIVLLWFKNPTT